MREPTQVQGMYVCHVVDLSAYLATQNRTLRTAATLAFSKFLCISSKFCDEHHHLLFKILETSKDPNIRSNIVIALGDVAVSFNNIIDENSIYSNDIYALLTTYGVEAARAAILKEVGGVFDVYKIDVDNRHLQLIADYMVRR